MSTTAARSKSKSNSNSKSKSKSKSSSRRIKRCFYFGSAKTDGDGSKKSLLGGKGANLAEMTSIGLPVPPGFTITTDTCGEYAAKQKLPAGLMDEVDKSVRKLEKELGKRFGSKSNPLLVSVRSRSSGFDARHDGHRSESRPDRRSSGGTR